MPEQKAPVKKAWKRTVYLFAAAGIIVFVLLNPVKFGINPGIVNSGEELLYPGLSSHISTWFMPLASVADALHANHCFHLQKTCLEKLILLLCVFLVFNLGRLLHSCICGFIAAGLSLFLCSHSADFEQFMYSITILLTANFLVAAFGSSHLSKVTGKVFVGLAIGISMFVKGILVFFPLVILVYEMFARRRRDFARFLKNAVPVVSVPCLVIVLWGGMHYVTSGEFLFFENVGRAHSNIITGALGLTGTMEGNPHVLAGISCDDNVLLWAAGEILCHPFRYLIAMTRRLWFVISLHPLLFLGSLIALWRFRKSREVTLVGLLAGYFLFIHCLMTVESRYFIPLWFLLCPVSASLIGLIRPASSRPAPQSQKGALTGIWLCFVPVFMAFSYAMGLFITYPAVNKIEEPDLNAVVENSNNPWLWSRLGHYYMKKGDWDNALPAFKKSYQLSPHIATRTDYVRALFARGDYKNAVIDGMSFEDFLADSADSHDWLILTLIKLEEGKYEQAKKTFKQAKANLKSSRCMFRKVTTPYEFELLDKLHDSDNSLVNDDLAGILVELPLERSVGLVEKLAQILKGIKKLPRILVDNTRLLRETAMRLQDKGEYDQALNLIQQLLARRPASGIYLNDLGNLLNKLPPEGRLGLVKKLPQIFAGNSRLLREMAMRLQDMGEYEQALSLVKQLLSQHPANAVYLSDSGVLKALMGTPSDAIMDFESAINVNPHYLPAYLSLATVYVRQNRENKALKTYELALERNRGAEKSDMYELISRNFKSLNSTRHRAETD